MNYIKSLNDFFSKVQSDQHIAPCQIVLYLALFQCWNKQRFQNPIYVVRDEIMRLSKITSKSTYHRSMNLLHESGYIDYEPSYNPYMGSKIFFKELEDPMVEITIPKKKKAVKKVIDKPIKQTSPRKQKAIDKAIDTRIEKPIEPLYKQINNKQINNKESLCKQAQISNLIFKVHSNNSLPNYQSASNDNSEEKEKSSAKKEKEIIPTLDEVKAFFQEKYQNTVEAEKFYYYFESNGWLVGGKTVMKNWVAAANNWMINADRFIKNNHSTFGVQKPLDTSANKRYDEPL